MTAAASDVVQRGARGEECVAAAKIAVMCASALQDELATAWRIGKIVDLESHRILKDYIR
jgi:hypothetical protein